MLALPLLLAPRPAAAGFLDFLFGNPPPAPQTSASADAPPGARSSGGGTAYCVRSCDGRYFPLSTRNTAAAAQMCQAFCPASNTKVYSGSTIDNAVSTSGERYGDSPNAFAYRKALKANCTCNGRDPTGLAPVDLAFDPTLRPGDVVATSNGLYAYAPNKVPDGQSGDFTPVADFRGLGSEVRARLSELKVAPVKADLPDDAMADDITGSPPEPKSVQDRQPAPQAAASTMHRADAN